MICHNKLTEPMIDSVEFSRQIVTAFWRQCSQVALTPVGHTDQVKEVISQSTNIHMCIYIYTIYTYIKTYI